MIDTYCCRFFSILCVGKFLRSKLSSEIYGVAVKINNYYY